MQTWKDKVFGVRLDSETYEQYKAYVTSKYSNMSIIGRVLVEKLLKGEIVL
ncbi:hypothetical protein MBAV_003121 [Candidatus Magnetobacterium bavaricum]|uniref:Uncharacterized protein n=1 Tax=Candidatus Magnetobacterium bavaricum TaxID=29290 RepID=A0A0F3GVI7_9BACT|nr:hypothetical protein MBAV_003121 [Candidatus Magnetobacterium bavaricum]